MAIGQAHEAAQVDDVTDLDGDGRREVVLGVRGSCDERPAALFLRPDGDRLVVVHRFGPCSVEISR